MGLGNPGRKYEDTRHNAGFLAVDYICDEHGIRTDKIKFKSLYTLTAAMGEPVVLAKPQTYMNLSGEAVADMARTYDIPPERIIVIFDDAAIVPGKVRIRRQGSDGGHNGIKSIIYSLQSDAFPRIKIGIGEKPEGEDMADYVLSPMEKATAKAAKHAGEIAKTIMESGVDAAMQKFNSADFS